LATSLLSSIVFPGIVMTTRTARVSLCMIVRDEEQNLAECLAPVAHLFDEIVIVDTGSHDRTKEIARSFTPHVHDFPWCDDFSAARNESLRHATGDWIFWLDADDRIKGDNVARLQHLLDTGLTEHPRVFYIDTVLAPAEATEEPALVTHPRLFRRSPSLRWEGRVHEQLTPCPSALGYEQIFTDLQIDHIGYQDPVLLERKSRRKIRLLRMDYAVDPNNPCTLLQLGLALGRTNRPEARRHLLSLVERNLGRLACVQRAYCTLAELAIHERQPHQAVQFAQRGLAIFPDDEHLLFTQAAAWHLLESYSAAIANLQRIIHSPPSPQLRMASPADIREKLAPRLLGSILRLQRSFPEAEATLKTILQRFPQDNISWYDLGMVYLDQVRMNEFAQVVQTLLRLPTGTVDAGLLTALWYLRNGNPQPAGPIIDQLISDAPRMSHPRMLRCEWLSRCGAPLEAQAQSLRDVIRIEPSNVEAPRWLKQIEHAQAAAAAPLPPALAPTTIPLAPTYL
jgi:tetratricopeptide (TPR) repeat protein